MGHQPSGPPSLTHVTSRGSTSESTVSCDLLVVGAGPAGSAAAITAAAKGLSVVLVDKATFPRDKCCGDGLTTLALRQLEDLGVRHRGGGDDQAVGGGRDRAGGEGERTESGGEQLAQGKRHGQLLREDHLRVKYSTRRSPEYWMIWTSTTSRATVITITSVWKR